ncbi:glycerophosphodiester phosphodiesterase [Halorarum salinum]|uniref:Glycerophosphodiester phosphodiesterase n=1 Tax=Halorarum salinum TaxID=2743089 RepID=A0A7D5L8F0_9EURY|nr:glycerophosphodiester phosphodiesterase [Halobaculum salinum]QLG60706.1 glycerophosphodiester phosphodiesterase [Halobaculum salinum]
MSAEGGRTRRELLAAVGASGAVALAGCSGSPGDRSGEPDATAADVRLIGHRGCADQYPENTVLAVEESAPHVDVVEVDVQRCGSGELVVFHDDQLNRLTDGAGTVSSTDWGTLRELTVLDSGEPIPLLSDLLAAVPPDTGVNVELKHEGMAADVLAAVEGVENEVLLSSFSADALRELRAESEDAALAPVFSDSTEERLSLARELGCEAVHPDHELVPGSDLVSTAHDDGFAVNAWTVDGAETAGELVEAGVDGLIVDRWDVLDG